MRRLLPAVGLLVGLGAHAQQDAPRLEASREIVAEFQSELGARLNAALGEGGAVEALRVCRVEAPGIAARSSRAAGARVGRTALKVRNPANAPDAAAVEAMEAFERELAAGADAAPPERFELAADGSARYMRAIVTQPLCLACHGPALTDDVREALARLYPEDEATGFEVGELRGAFVVDWPAGGAPP